MGRVINSITRGMVVLLAIGVMLIYMSGTMFITSLKPSKSFDDLWQTVPEKGMHIKGDVMLSYECFSYEETWRENNGSRTKAKTSAYYYAVPVNDAVIALEIPARDYDAMEDVVDETFHYLYEDGTEPSFGVAVEGRIKEMDFDLEGMFREYLISIGYTEEEIDGMGEFLMIEQPISMLIVRIMFGIGVLLILISIIIFTIRFKNTGMRRWD